MKRRKNIIISAITCMFSICLMMFGVYAAASPTITLSGQVSYTVRDARILVQGATQTDKFATDSGYKTMEYKNTVPTQQDFDTSTLTQSLTGIQYAAWTLGTGTNEADIADWSEVNLNFEENNNGIKPITLGFQMSNYSNYPVKATVTVTTTSLTNVSVDNATQSVTLSKYTTAPSTKELFVTYKVTDDSQNASGNIAISIVFEKYVEPAGPKAYYTNAAGEKVETAIEDWEYTFENDSYTITKYVGDLTSVGENLYIPSSITDTNGKSYPVKALGAVDMTYEELMDSSEADLFGYSILYNMEALNNMEEEAQQEYLQMLSTVNVVIPEGIEAINTCALLSASVQSLPTSIKSVGVYGVCDLLGGGDISTLQTLNLPNIESIDAGAFYSNVNLTSVTLGDKLESIGMSAFYGCSGLTSITIPSGVTNIEDEAFAATGLTSIIISSSVTSIGEQVFGYCSGLESITVDANNTVYTSANGSNCLIEISSGTLIQGCNNSVIPTDGSVISIGSSAFSRCSGLTSVTIPSSVTSIGSSAFNKCTGLKNITIGNASVITTRYVFDNCSAIEEVTISSGDICNGGYSGGYQGLFANKTSLKTVTLGEGVTSIGSYAFYNCSSLTSITIPSSVTSIGSDAFRNCGGLTGELIIPNSVTSIGSSAFYNCSGLKNITIGNASVITSSGVFYGCSAIEEVTISSGDIHSYLFSSITSLKTLTLGEGVTSIGSSAFRGCRGLTSITIPSSVTSIGSNAFYGCYRLAEVINLSSLSITAGSTSNGDVGRYAVRIAISGASAITTTSDGYKFITGDDGNNYLIDYIGTATKLTLPTNGSYKINQYAFYQYKNLTSITISEGVTSIGEWAFYYCSGLTSVTIPISVTSIGNYAFYYCSGLKNDNTLHGNAYYLGNEVNPYLVLLEAKDTSITECTINSATKFIHSRAFENCTSLTSITIPSSVTSIGQYAFYYCRGLTGELIIPNGVTSIGNYAFYGCSGLTSITIPSSVTMIGDDRTFYNCSSLESITVDENNTVYTSANGSNCLIEISSGTLIQGCNNSVIPTDGSVTSIGQYAFYYCRGLTGELIIPNGVTSIGNYAFYGCSGLTSITIPSSVTMIGDDRTFYNCSSLESITVDENNTVYTSANGSNCLIEISSGTLIQGCNNSVIPTDGSVTSIGSYAFYYCSGLTSITIPEGVTSIGGDNAFDGCRGLTNITIPSSVTSIGFAAFNACSYLETVTFEGTTPPTSIGSYIFSNCSNLTAIYVPSESVEAYKAVSNLSEYADKIQAIA